MNTAKEIIILENIGISFNAAALYTPNKINISLIS